MPRNWTKLRNLGSHGIKADEMFGSIGEVVKKGGVLKMQASNGDEHSELIPALPKGMLPNNLKLRYLLYSLAISPHYQLGRESDPSRKVAAKAQEICEEMAGTIPGYRVPISYDARKRDAIIEIVKQRAVSILTDSFQQAVTDEQNILRFLMENRDSEQLA
jgi:hypothetical protein